MTHGNSQISVNVGQEKQCNIKIILSFKTSQRKRITTNSHFDVESVITFLYNALSFYS